MKGMNFAAKVHKIIKNVKENKGKKFYEPPVINII